MAPSAYAMHIRPATMADALLLLEWRNDPDTRANSVSTDVVALEQHMAWLERVLVSPSRRLHVAEVDGVPVGTVREDDDDAAVELSWTVAPAWRGMGIGSRMVKLLATRIDRPLVARVKPGNAASMKIAGGAGMLPTGHVDGLAVFRRG